MPLRGGGENGGGLEDGSSLMLMGAEYREGGNCDRRLVWGLGKLRCRLELGKGRPAGSSPAGSDGSRATD